MTQQKNPKRQRLIAMDHQYVAPAGRVSKFDLVVDHGLGAKIWDVDGNAYIDFLASASAVNVGHGNAKVVAAIHQQTDKLIHYISGYFYHGPAIKLAKRLALLAPGKTPKKVSFSTSGSEAAEAVVKFARSYTKRSVILTFQNSWHGTTLGAASLSAIDGNMHRDIGPLIPDIHHLPFPDPNKRFPGESITDFSSRYLKDFTDLFEHDIPADQVAAILIEPIQGDAGIIMPPNSYMQGLYQLCHENGILFCTDEINQGFGRSGKLWSIDHFNLEPDLMAVGKSLASGMPLSAIIGKAPIMDTLASPANATTTAANPICCAAALATIDELEALHLTERSDELGKFSKTQFLNLQKDFPVIKQVRMVGLNGGIEFEESQTKLVTDLCNYCFEHGLIIISTMDHILRFQPPLVITKDELTQGINIIREGLLKLT
ncbi:aminotransferase class III-fold pyridoxal phosphate-dependent enzyme [Pediococcus inopinatus]|uniref:Aminotransferase class III-fold pyridoxal phosphate-dependent enzyme n=1 Tax=Pediococcus inopinatus TaxID=114090 RepID=A0ABZ0Q6G0_9LACO|nr:aminotransferase class III-fold pyridoxal phosphate-dependent enzyme [Pediococcus inopinatus]KRN61068.1 aminotransferase [Pediococcus inopinatus]WPC20048.1 aminotransferase class III-fold pyridoxal phosphate-dependent enzyme [Pediococcus inopinatus]WPC21750.1 aminotransferase class III-fold pyridoxal phosphate-dependent enzyme [Pediococcus inopinatus]WPP09321.1 aminotransferase class III-fold pyridoxal phosphate-dependent enzyme [Pediococcus inopinatus]